LPDNSAYLDSIALVRTVPCLAEPGKIIVIGSPSRDLGDVLPYLATLPNIITYNPDAQTLTFRRPRGFLTLYSDKVVFWSCWRLWWMRSMRRGCSATN